MATTTRKCRSKKHLLPGGCGNPKCPEGKAFPVPASVTPTVSKAEFTDFIKPATVIPPAATVPPAAKTKADGLSARRKGTVVNTHSKKQEKELTLAVDNVLVTLQLKYPEYSFTVKKRLMLSVLSAKIEDTDYEKEEVQKTTYMAPDGGFVYLEGKDGTQLPILISEVKKQGTNDGRLEQGLAPQPTGNAVERLGKNVIGLRDYMGKEDIFPFVCFCYGDDFKEGSTIRDRVTTIAHMAKLNKIHLDRTKSGKLLGSYFVNTTKKTVQEMETVLEEISTRSVEHYKNKYGNDFFSSASTHTAAQ